MHSTQDIRVTYIDGVPYVQLDALSAPRAEIRIISRRQAEEMRSRIQNIAKGCQAAERANWWINKHIRKLNSGADIAQMGEATHREASALLSRIERDCEAFRGRTLAAEKRMLQNAGLRIEEEDEPADKKRLMAVASQHIQADETDQALKLLWDVIVLQDEQIERLAGSEEEGF